MTGLIRPDWRTIARRHPLSHPDALAAVPGECEHGQYAEVLEPIVLIGSVIVLEPDGRKHVDLSGAEWHPQQCLAVEVPGDA